MKTKASGKRWVNTGSYANMELQTQTTQRGTSSRMIINNDSISTCVSMNVKDCEELALPLSL
jgi:hypothetical protein